MPDCRVCTARWRGATLATGRTAGAADAALCGLLSGVWCAVPFAPSPPIGGTAACHTLVNTDSSVCAGAAGSELRTVCAGRSMPRLPAVAFASRETAACRTGPDAGRSRARVTAAAFAGRSGRDNRAGCCGNGSGRSARAARPCRDALLCHPFDRPAGMSAGGRHAGTVRAGGLSVNRMIAGTWCAGIGRTILLRHTKQHRKPLARYTRARNPRARLCAGSPATRDTGGSARRKPIECRWFRQQATPEVPLARSHVCGWIDAFRQQVTVGSFGQYASSIARCARQWQRKHGALKSLAGILRIPILTISVV